MKSRRALSSVVGAVFSIIALSTTVGYVAYSMNILDQYNQSILATNANALDRNKEEIQVTRVTIDNNKFNITASNTGNIPVHLTKLWVTNTTDVGKVFQYGIDYSLSSGQSQIKIGQSLPIYAKTNQAYDLKLITDRGNVKEFTVNSVGTAPLNIQLLAVPATIPSDFTTVLVMIVTNNQSSTLTNLVPQISKSASTAACVPSAAPSPPSVSTLTPGSTAVFKWDLKLTGKDGQYCTYTASLYNGFSGNTASATATINAITATSSNWSTTWGILSLNYTTLQWTQNGGATWNNAWSVPHGINTVWRIDISNNDPTRPFIFNGNSTLVAFGTSPGSNEATQWYIIKNDYPPEHAYPTNGQTVPANSTQKLYFAASTAAGSDGVNIGQSAKGQYAISILLFGYWSSVLSSNFFGQNIPYEGIIIT
ncbi:hypothetical protein HY212_06145 [Candidatus Pacearchaeota archaeon]|nr:hypothetical protein [Candidatus Pacearchaeota archaeon]